jgi:hypothetical protein
MADVVAQQRQRLWQHHYWNDQAAPAVAPPAAVVAAGQRQPVQGIRGAGISYQVSSETDGGSNKQD